MIDAAKWLSSSRTILSEFMAFIERFASSTDDPWTEAAKRPLKTHEFSKKYYAAGLAIWLRQLGLATAREVSTAVGILMAHATDLLVFYIPKPLRCLYIEISSCANF